VRRRFYVTSFKMDFLLAEIEISGLNAFFCILDVVAGNRTQHFNFSFSRKNSPMF